MLNSGISKKRTATHVQRRRRNSIGGPPPTPGPILSAASSRSQTGLEATPLDILWLLNKYLGPEDQVCLALSCRSMFRAASHLKLKEPEIRDSGAEPRRYKIELILRLEGWVKAGETKTKYCKICRKCRSVDVEYWMDSIWHRLPYYWEGKFKRELASWCLRDDWEFCPGCFWLKRLPQ